MIICNIKIDITIIRQESNLSGLYCANITPTSINKNDATKDQPNFSSSNIHPPRIPKGATRYTYNAVFHAPIVTIPSANQT